MGKTGGWFERSESRGVVQHAFESLLVRDPRRFLILTMHLAGRIAFAATPYFAGGDFFASLTLFLIKSE
jgi:hypothetical protein